jgi:hypothetical protein
MGSMIMIRCPVSDMEVPTGTRAKLVELDNLTGVFDLICPACGSSHVWSKNNAWLQVTTTRKKRPSKRNQTSFGSQT